MIQPLPLVPTIADLIKLLNERFRALNQAATVTAPGLFVKHTERTQTDATKTAGMFLAETDRGLVYQSQKVGGALVWKYVAGMMAGTLAAQPIDLDTGDTGLLYLTNDTFELYRWSGTAWVNLTPANLLQIAYASGALTLTNAYQDITGATLTLTRAGRHLITAVLDFNLIGTDLNFVFSGQLVANAVAQANTATFVGEASGERASVAQQWSFTAAAAGQIVKLQAKKAAGTGTSVAGTQTSLAALWIGY